MKIRAAIPDDVPAILNLITELAVYEREPDAVINTAEELTRDLFEERICEAIVCELEDDIVGFALFYTSYSTWKGKCMYLEDLYVREAHRRKGIGDVLFDQVVTIARQRGYKRMDWQVLEKNEPSRRDLLLI